jgi:transcriptional regulator with XRE-family HTH domain
LSAYRQTVPVGSTGRRVAAAIRANRLRLGWSTDRLATEVNRLGCPTGGNAIVKIEGFTRRVTVDELVAFAEALGVEPAQLLVALACEKCHGAPVPWSACLACGAEGPR